MKRGAENQLRREDVDADEDDGPGGGLGAQGSGGFQQASAEVLAQRRKVSVRRGGASAAGAAPASVPKFSFGGVPKAPAPVLSGGGAAAPKTDTQAKGPVPFSFGAPKSSAGSTPAATAAPKFSFGVLKAGASSAAPKSGLLTLSSSAAATAPAASGAAPKASSTSPGAGAGSSASGPRPVPSFSFAAASNPSAAALVDAESKRPTFSFGAPVATPKDVAAGTFGSGLKQSFGSVGGLKAGSGAATSFSTGFTFTNSTAGASAAKGAIGNVTPKPMFGGASESHSPAGNKVEEEDRPPSPEVSAPTGPAQGEEDEDVVQLFRAKLFVLEGKSWADKGLGQLKVLRSKSGPPRTRLIMRREKSKVLMLNAPVSESLKFKAQPGQKDPRAAQFMCRPNVQPSDGAEPVRPVPHSLKLASVADYKALAAEVETGLAASGGASLSAATTAEPAKASDASSPSVGAKTGSVPKPALFKAPVAKQPVMVKAPVPKQPVVAKAPVAKHSILAKAPIAKQPVLAQAPSAKQPVLAKAPIVKQPVLPKPSAQLTPSSDSSARIDSEVVHDRPVLHTLVKADAGAPAQSAAGIKRPATTTSPVSEAGPPASKRAKPTVTPPQTVAAPSPAGPASAGHSTPNRVARPTTDNKGTPYLKFCAQQRKVVSDANPGAPFMEVAKILASKWQALTESERDSFN